jgi:hypothetical protein
MAGHKMSFDQQTLDMTTTLNDDLPQYDENNVPEYELSEKTGLTAASTATNATRTGGNRNTGGDLTAIVSNNLDDEKTRVDLNNVMSAIERLSKIAPRMDNQRVQLSLNQKRQMARASVAHTIERLSKDRWNEAGTANAASSSSMSPRQKKMAEEQASSERTRDLNKLVNQIVESANRASFVAQRA